MQGVEMLSKLFSTSKVELIGVYPIHVTRDSINKAVIYHLFDWMIDDMGNYNLPIDWNMFENLVLVELQWAGKFTTERLKGVLHQFEVPYMPFFLSTDGECLLNEESAMQASDRRICFFLHKFKITEPIVIGKKTIKVNTLSELPLRLKPFTHYVPVEDDDEDEE
jgi:hypothetical protein